MKLWKDAVGEKLQIPVWWLEANLEGLANQQDLSLRQNAKEIQKQIDAARK